MEVLDGPFQVYLIYF